MAKDYTNLPNTYMRRADRAVGDDAWIRSFLARSPYGIMATVDGDQPFINSNLFVYDESVHAIYLHTARSGRTRSNVEASPLVCFSISEMGRLLPAAEALEFSVEYKGVTVFGMASVVTDAEEAHRGLQLLLDKYAPHLRPGRDYRPITAEELRRTCVYRIDIDQWSGKRKQVEANFPGAYYYGDGDVVTEREYHHGAFVISSDQEWLEFDMIFHFLDQEAYWVTGITPERMRRQIRHSLCFGVYEIADGQRRQVGFGRAITDFATMAHLADIFILEPYRGRGLGKWLVASMLEHPELKPVPVWELKTRDAHEFYRRFGFKAAEEDGRRMVMHRRP